MYENMLSGNTIRASDINELISKVNSLQRTRHYGFDDDIYPVSVGEVILADKLKEIVSKLSRVNSVLPNKVTMPSLNLYYSGEYVRPTPITDLSRIINDLEAVNWNYIHCGYDNPCSCDNNCDCGDWDSCYCDSNCSSEGPGCDCDYSG